MKQRIDPMKMVPEQYRAVFALERVTGPGSGLEERLLHLIKLRAAQVNGCSYCVDMHVKEMRKFGESEQRIALVAAWRESPLYAADERALLQWVEAVTLIAKTGAPDADYAELQKHFSEEQIARITLAICTINVWNRIAVAFRLPHPIDAKS
jgi:AhpD family alkylhydroperoxidase